MNNPEIDGMRIPSAKSVSEFTIGAKDQQFSRVKAADAAHEISQVMQAAAKSQREANAVNAKSQIKMAGHHPVQPPKVISGPQIMGKGIELSQV